MFGLRVVDLLGGWSVIEGMAPVVCVSLSGVVCINEVGRVKLKREDEKGRARRV